LNRLYNEEHVLYSLRSVYSFQSALADYINSVRTLLEAGFNMVENQIITDTVYRIMKNVNELQKFSNQKIEIFSQKYTKAELYALYLEYKPMNEQYFPKYVRELYDLTRKCFCTNWKRTQISEEVHQFFLLYNHQKKLLNEFQSYQNDTTNILLSEEVCCKELMNENKETYFIDNESYDECEEE
jgi:hypothetical protein